MTLHKKSSFQLRISSVNVPNLHRPHSHKRMSHILAISCKKSKTMTDSFQRYGWSNNSVIWLDGSILVDNFKLTSKFYAFLYSWLEPTSRKRPPQSRTKYLETFSRFAIAFFHHKWNWTKLLSAESDYTSCLTSCPTPQDLRP